MTMKLLALSAIVTISTLVVLVSSSFKDLTMVTRNAGLNNWMVMPRDYRLAAIIRQLNYFDADFACLQGVWFQSDLEEILLGVNHTYQHAVSTAGMVQRAPDTPICPDIVDLLVCIDSFCSNSSQVNITSGKALYACTVNNCSTELMDLTAECRLCLLYATNETSLWGNEFCFEPTNDTMNMYGLLFLSKKKIRKSVFYGFDNDTDIEDLADPRGFLEITFKKIEGVTICTQLSEQIFDLPFFEPNVPQYETHDGRNLAQIERLMNHTSNMTHVMMLGSFNTGPKFQCKTAKHFKSNYKQVLKIMPPFAVSIVHRCTKCHGKEKHAVDHIFIRGWFLRHSHRVFRDDTIASHAGMSAYVLNA